jgi:hypothetical protein
VSRLNSGSLSSSARRWCCIGTIIADRPRGCAARGGYAAVTDTYRAADT